MIHPTKPSSLDETITHYVNRGLIHEDRWRDLELAIATAVKEIIGVDTGHKPFKQLGDPLCHCEIENELRAEQRQRLNEWLGDK